MGVLELLATDNFITYSKVIARQYGVNCAILLGALCSYQVYYGEDNEFYKEQEKISEDTCLSKYEISHAIKILSDADILEVSKKGLPARNFYKLSNDKLSKILTTGHKKTEPLEVENFDHYINNNNNNKNISNKNINNKKKERKNATNYDAIISGNIHDEGVKEALYEFIKMRTLIKKPLTDRALERIISKLQAFTADKKTAIAILNQSIINDWQDIYPLKDNQKQQPTQKGKDEGEDSIYDFSCFIAKGTE